MWMCCTVKLPDLCWIAALAAIILKRLSKWNGFKMTCKVIRRLPALYVFDRTTCCDSFGLWAAALNLFAPRLAKGTVCSPVSDKGSATFYFSLLLIHRSACKSRNNDLFATQIMPERQKVESQVISLNTDFSLPMPESSHPNAWTACQFSEKI